MPAETGRQYKKEEEVREGASERVSVWVSDQRQQPDNLSLSSSFPVLERACGARVGVSSADNDTICQSVALVRLFQCGSDQRRQRVRHGSVTNRPCGSLDVTSVVKCEELPMLQHQGLNP